MEKMSQKQLVNEGFKEMLRKTAKAVAKEISPTAVGAYDKAKGIIKTAKKALNNTPKGYVQNWVDQFPDLIYDITNIQVKELPVKKPEHASFKRTIDNRSQTSTLHKVSFNIRFRDPNTHEPVKDVTIPLKGLPIKGIKNEDSGDMVYSLAGHEKEIDLIIQNLLSKHPESREALDEFNRKVLQNALKDQEREEEKKQDDDVEDIEKKQNNFR